MNVHTRWRESEKDAACIARTRKLFDAVTPFASGSAYVNFMAGDEPARVEEAYGVHYRRLAEIKRRHDPEILFRVNQNIRPS